MFLTFGKLGAVYAQLSRPEVMFLSLQYAKARYQGTQIVESKKKIWVRFVISHFAVCELIATNYSNFGLRFSRKAVRPSWWSAVLNESGWAMASHSSVSSKESGWSASWRLTSAKALRGWAARLRA
jgi:hypothetical protein